MATTEERLRILRMIEQGQISADEGARLLVALGEREGRDEEPSPGVEKGPRRFRIRVFDLETGKQKVDLALPWVMLNVGIRMGAQFTPAGIDVDALNEAIQSGNEGKIVEYEDREKGERVELFVE